MAPLNPTVQPTNDPNFRGYSSPINVPDTIKPQGVQQNQILPRGQEIGDRSAEYEGKGQAYGMAAEGASMAAYGDLFKNIAQMGEFVGKAGVAVTKKNIEDKVYQIADRERQSYTETLEQIKKNGGVNNILNPVANDGVATPDEVESLGDTLTSLKTAKDNGKISSSYYQGRLLSEAKRLRAEYPGFRQDIDDAFAKVTGMNPANAYMRALTTDLNRAAAGVGREVKKAENFVTQRAGYPNAGVMMEAVRTGRAGLKEVMDWSAPYEQEDFNLNRRAKIMTDEKATREFKATRVGELVDYAGGVAVGRSIDTMSARMGINSAEDASKLDTAVKAGIVPQQQWVQWGQELAQHKTQLDLQMTKDGHKSGAIQILGATEFNKRKAEALKPLDTMIERIYNKDVGGYYRMSQDLKGINEEGQKRLLENPRLGPYLQQMQALKEIGGEQNLQKFMIDTIKGDFNADHQTYFTRWKAEFQTQLSMKKDGVPTTFNNAIDDIKAKGIKDTRLNNAVLNEVTKITNSDIPEAVKLNYAAAAFSPENRGMIGKLSADGVDSKGRPITGQSAVFQKFTSPEMTKEMFKLGQKNPQVWKNYVDWAQETLANELINKDINSLAEIRNPHIRVGWDSDNKRFVTRYDSARSASEINTRLGSVPQYGSEATDTEYQNVIRMTNRMNSNLHNYKNIAEAAGINPDDFVLKTIANTNPDALRNVNSLPYNILRDIGLAKTRGIGSK